MMDFKEYPDREMLALSLADRIASQLAQHLRGNDRATLCVPGGTSPAPVFETLSGADLDWARVTVVLGDERWVDGDHKRSNSRLRRFHEKGKRRVKRSSDSPPTVQGTSAVVALSMKSVLGRASRYCRNSLTGRNGMQEPEAR